MQFQTLIRQGIPSQLPSKKERSTTLSHAPKRKDLLSMEEKKLALRNALRYFPKDWHATLAVEFWDELQNYGRIYMYRFMPDYAMKADPFQTIQQNVLRQQQSNLWYRITWIRP